MNQSVLIISFSFEQEPDAFEELRKSGLEPVVWKAEERKGADEDALIAYYRALKEKPSGIIMGADIHISERFLTAAPEVRVISLNCAGYDHIDLDACRKHGVTVMNVPRHNFDAVADLIWGLIIATMRNIRKGDIAIREGSWNKGVERSMAVSGRKLGIIGLGAIGKAVAKRAAGFDMEIAAYDVFRNPAYEKEYGLRYLELDELLKTADIIALCCPYTESNHHMINAETLGMMKKSAVLINTARGGLVDADALYEALKNRRIAGAALDAYEEEPLTASPLFGLDNIILTPHVGGLADKQIRDVAMQSAVNYVSFYKDDKYDKNVITGGEHGNPKP